MDILPGAAGSDSPIRDGAALAFRLRFPLVARDWLKAKPASLFWLIFALYALLWARQGLDTKDGGFLLGTAWKVLHGDVLYRDVIYAKPPIPIYLRMIPLMFGDFAFYADRIMCLGEFAVSVIAGSAILFRALGREGDRDLFWVFCSCAFVMSVHNFPMFGWFTVDGVLFSTLGLLALTRRNFVLAGILAAGAMLCKQNFAAVTLICGVLAAATGAAAVLRYGLGVAAALLGMAAVLESQGALQPMLALNLGVGSAQDILNSGLWAYVTEFRKTDASIAMACALVVLLLRANHPGTLRADVYAALVLTILFGFTYRVILGPELIFRFFFFGAGVLLIFSPFWVVDWLARQKALLARGMREFLSKALAPLAGLFAVAWVASISFGYPTPAYFGVPLLAPLVLTPLSSAQAVMRLGLTTAVALAAFGAALAYPYNENTRIDKMVAVPAFVHGAALMRTSVLTAAKLQDLSSLLSRAHRPLIVLPGFSPFEVLFNVKSPSPVTWSYDADFRPENRPFYTNLILDRICRSRGLVAVETDWAKITQQNPEAILIYSSVLARIQERWPRTGSTAYFTLYEPPDAC